MFYDTIRASTALVCASILAGTLTALGHWIGGSTFHYAAGEGFIITMGIIAYYMLMAPICMVACWLMDGR